MEGLLVLNLMAYKNLQAFFVCSVLAEKYTFTEACRVAQLSQL